jgi:hypothetical protein
MTNREVDGASVVALDGRVALGAFKVSVQFRWTASPQLLRLLLPTGCFESECRELPARI